MSSEDIFQRAARREITTEQAADELLEERIELQTVNHKARTAILFGAFAWVLLAVIFWITSTPKRWIGLVVAVAISLGLYFSLR